MTMEKYLKEHYYDEIASILNDTNDRTHAALQVDLSQLQQHKFQWFDAILDNVYVELPKWDAAVFAAQKSIASEDEGFLEDGYQIKIHCHVRFVRFPPPDPRFKLPFPNSDQIGLFREVKGTVVRMSQMKLLELKREFVCSKCREIVEVEADYSLMYRFEVPKSCSVSECKGNMHQKNVDPLPDYCVNYQELKVQEALSEKNIPPTLNITLDVDLVDSCQPGDCVTICGTIERRWISFNEGNCNAVIAMRAVSLTREQNNLTVDANGVSEQMMTIKADWVEHLNKHGELGLRDLILKSICPDIHGMYAVKLAIALAICSGNDLGDGKSSDGLHQRGQSHILMIGDPGLAKSKLLLSAVAIAPRAVHTTGMGCSTAGLTAAAIKEDGEWQLEAGALVLADGGICCIDEFNLMRESDRSSIHEAMEQQTISMAKAGIVCKLNTRCAILAAANPRNLHAMSEPEGTNSINIGIATPLLSRFDLVFILKDERIPEWDQTIADHLLASVTTGFKDIMMERNTELWSAQKLQSHFNAISQVHPKMTPIASAILGAYYRKCRSDPGRDQGRTTVRLLDSLNRLAEAHARLVFRDEVTVIDAIITIRLMESTFGFGRIVKPYDVIKEHLPLGPDQEEIKCISNILEIDEEQFLQNGNEKMVVKEVQSKFTANSSQNSQNKVVQNATSQNHLLQKQDQIPNILDQIPKTQNALNQNTRISQLPTQSQKPEPLKPSQMNEMHSSHSQAGSFQKVVDMDIDELDELLSFDVNDGNPKNEEDLRKNEEPAASSKPTKDESKNCMSDDEDLVLSQALDDLERSQMSMCEPKPKMPKIDLKQPLLKFSRFAFSAPKNRSKENAVPLPSSSNPSTSAANESSNDSSKQNKILTVIQPIRNGIFCTPSDDEHSQNETFKRKLSVKTLNILHTFEANQNSNKDEVLQQQNITLAAKSGESHSENDSAYDTMIFDPSFPSTATSCFKTGKTPALFPPSGDTQNKIDADDLSFLDTLEF